MNNQSCTPAPFTGIERDVNDLFRGFFAGATPAATSAVDIQETAQHYLVELDLPGVAMEAIDLSFAEKTLTLKVEAPKADEVQDEDVKWHRRARRRIAMNESIRFPKPVDSERIDAALDKGVLSITLPKTAAVQARSIQIRG
jgi:HSP20 family protein